VPEPTVTRLTVTDSTLLVLRFAGSIPENVDDALATLRDLTPGSVIVVDDTVPEVIAVQREDAEEALADALPRAYPFADWGDGRQRRDAGGSLLDELREAGWALIRLDQ
jgi:hypothetical protein